MPPTTPPPIPSAEATKYAEFLTPSETMLAIVHRHPIGLIGLYLAALIGIIVVIGFFVLVTPNLLDNLFKQSSRALLGGIIFAVAILIFFLFVSTYVYRQSRLIITNKSLVEINQVSLFIRKVARLSMSNVEDVNSDQRGILATFFNYGTLTIQTAGEMDNFVFKYCPTPVKYADIILEARQAYAESLQEEELAKLTGGHL